MLLNQVVIEEVCICRFIILEERVRSQNRAKARAEIFELELELLESFSSMIPNRVSTAQIADELLNEFYVKHNHERLRRKHNRKLVKFAHSVSSSWERFAFSSSKILILYSPSNDTLISSISKPD